MHVHQVTLRQLRTGETLDLVDCFRMEYMLASKYLEGVRRGPGKPGGDFSIGVDHVLVKRGKGPAPWNPPSLTQVRDEDVEWFFNDDTLRRAWRPFAPITYQRYPTAMGLPSEHDVQATVHQLIKTGKTQKPTLEQVVASLQRGGSAQLGTTAKPGLAEKVRWLLEQSH